MTLIYEPKGKAREYSPLALNIYNGCDHGCKYCYVPMIRKDIEANKVVKERSCFLTNLEKELNNNISNIHKKQILLCFMCDPYNHRDCIIKATRFSLKMLNRRNCKVAILTKSGSRCLRDLDIFKQFGDRIKVGATLTFINEQNSLDIEPNAATPQDRLDTLKILHKNGIKTFISIEPVIDPIQSIELIKLCLPFIDQFKVGKINYFEKRFADKPIDWHKFLTEAVTILRKAEKQFYIKEDLRAFDYDKILLSNEINYDYLNL